MNRFWTPLLVVFGIVLAWTREASASTGRIVHIDAYEHGADGVVLDDGRVLVSFFAVEVDRPGPIAVVDANGTNVDAWVTSTDRGSGFALLTTALPVVTDRARTRALTSKEEEALPRLTVPSAPRERRSWIFYGGGSMQFDVAGKGGLWWGGSASLGVRYHDLIELRVDNEVAFLMPTTPHRECGEPPCFAGARGVFTPSIGPRIRIGGRREDSIALTPSIGYAFGAQVAWRDEGAPALEVATPVWSRFAPGLSFSYAGFEARIRYRVPQRATDTPAFELALAGFYF